MKIQKTFFILVLAMITFSSVNAQLLVNGEYRSRFQALHGFKKPVTENKDALFGFDQRSRINLDFKSDKFSTRFTLQDARVWGASDIYNGTGIVGNSNAIDIYEAWVDVKIAGNSSVKVGRQEWNYDDMRILSFRNWWTTGLSYDGILYKMHNENSGLFVDFGMSYNNDGTKNGSFTTDVYADRIKTVNFLSIKKKFSPSSSLSFMFSAIGKQDVTRADAPLLVKGTHGMNFILNQGKKADDGLTAKISAYYQHGTDKARVSDGSTYKSVSAYLIDAQVGFRMMSKKVEILVGSELISGNDAANTDAAYNDVQHVFDLHYSGLFPYYGGNINQFINGASSVVGTKGGGLLDPYVKMKFSPAKGKTIGFNVWMPMLGTNVVKEVNATGDNVYYDKSLGYNFDLNYTHKFSKSIIFKIGGSYAMISDTKNHMFYGGYADPATQTLTNAGQNYFVYTVLTIKPTFFQGKKD